MMHVGSLHISPMIRVMGTNSLSHIVNPGILEALDIFFQKVLDQQRGICKWGKSA